MKSKILAGLFFASIMLAPAVVSAQFGCYTGTEPSCNPGSGLGPGTGAPPGSQLAPASGNTGSCGGKLCNPISAGSIPALVAAILNIVVAVGSPIIVFFLIYAGFLFVTARGNVSQLERSKHALLYTLIGGLIILGAFLISEVICSTVSEVSGKNIC